MLGEELSPRVERHAEAPVDAVTRPQLFQNQTSRLGSSIPSAATSCPPRTAASGPIATWLQPTLQPTSYRLGQGMAYHREDWWRAAEHGMIWRRAAAFRGA